jgi:5-methylcytosine-specific restriction enzyme subunit McrC
LRKQQDHITVFEHERLYADRGEKQITPAQLKALQSYYGNGVPYFSLCNNGVQFNEHVGVIQVGPTLIEVLPKADKNAASEVEEKKWRDLLIGMLKAVGSFDIKATSNSTLKIKPNTILDLYFEMFIKETEYLLHNGLIKKYRKKEGNVTALKGNLLFAKNIQQNLTHNERFYVRYSTYDVEHTLHCILYKAINLLKQINANAALHGRIGALLLYFPEMPDLKVTGATFEKLSFNRKTYGYKKAIEIARLLLLQYHPDVSKGRNNVLALMFDMNVLWEQFVVVSLRRQKEKNWSVTSQTSKYFWQPEKGIRSQMRPDIVLNKDKDNCIVLDTKWKNLGGYNPSPADLRQLYVYQQYYTAQKVALVYPGSETNQAKGNFLDFRAGNSREKECSVITIAVQTPVKAWQQQIREDFLTWMQQPISDTNK